MTIREMTDRDPPIIESAFTAQGWNKAASLYVSYLEESRVGKRVNLVAEFQGEIAGYVTIVWESDYPPFRQESIPEIVDFNVLIKFRRLGIGTELMDEAERRISARSRTVGLGVCLHVGYGPAQRLYALRGYVPDGRGVYYQERYPDYGEQVRLDDDLAIYMTKELG